jgi:hypothetical protein
VEVAVKPSIGYFELDNRKSFWLHQDDYLKQYSINQLSFLYRVMLKISK